MLTWKPYTAAKLLLLAAVLFAIVLVAGVLFAIVALFALLAPIAANLVIGEVTDLQQMLIWMTMSIRTSTVRAKLTSCECASRYAQWDATIAPTDQYNVISGVFQQIPDGGLRGVLLNAVPVTTCSHVPKGR